jgi:ADP-ribose pyrophosphatase YjhB (NUDIX family)
VAGQVITAALVVVPGPDGTVTFVRQERGPYAGWWLLPGGKWSSASLPVPAQCL